MDISLSSLNRKKRGTYYLFLLLLVTVLVAIAFISCVNLHGFNGDNLFMFAHTKVLKEQGFVSTDVLRMHEDFHFLIPQWLFAYSFSEIIDLFGPKAASIAMMGVMFLMVIALYYCCYDVSGDKATSVWVTTICAIVYYFTYSSIRPFNVSVLLGLLQILVLEKYTRTHDYRYLFLISIISILEVNFHNSLWILLTLINMCYMGEGVFNKLFHKSGYSIKEIFLVCVTTVLSGLLNPYGIEGMLYIFPSMQSIEPLKIIIGEIRPLSFTAQPVRACIVCVMCLIDAICLYLYWKKKKIPAIRYLFMYFGFLILGLRATRNMQFFIIFSQFATIECKRCLFQELPYKEIKSFGLGAVLFQILLFICFFDSDYYLTKDYEKAAHYLTEQGVSKDAKIFSTADCGSALIYEGYKPYYDCMAELYGIANNHKKDVASEIVEFIYMDEEASREFLNSYGFQYAVVHDPYFEKKFRNLPEWDCIYSLENGWVFVHN